MSEQRILVTYLTQAKDLNKKAAAIAVGMTVGSWTDLPATKQAELAPYLGEAVNATPLETLENGDVRGLITVSYPTRNFTSDIPSLLTGIFGKLSMDGKIKLVDIAFPDSFLQAFPGPKFGIDGLRGRLDAQNRPLLMSIFKSCLGLPFDDLKTQFKAQAQGGVDLVKDDEIFFADDRAPFLERIQAFKQIALETEAETGKPVLYAANLTGPINELNEKAKRAVEAGADCLLFNVLAFGFDALHRLAADPDVNVPIMAHPALAGAYYPSPDYGIATPLLLGTLMRIAGADLVLFPSPYGNVALDKTEALQLAHNLTTPLEGVRRSFPVPSAGIHPGLVPQLYQDFGLDQIVNAGGGIHGHPGGATAGAKAFVDAIAAVTAGRSLEEAAAGSPELAIALEKWGGAR
ncbi:2,3-diketo-5-methylthiopentyl-1-phosphate enolase [Brevibacillus agri]|uniref:2,3-diketo-5-methylthiopentyl-1-phosphate enolase n=1 Tax=Brevibacillus agri TaxID=51101 RepID=UPI002E1A6C3E|nr:2,3-diketo-5-methylthiopentyl-1-phosphate enolase [Brevibacillus agri]MED1653325.1 2,3-diketo-5-methylthiopentyl-1-phosphate enolase [Brevibacillus agri]MED1687162.1 2,3-diketo-5-methylthiopentyl-1-phosphate enolase [Brevibacillus agri]MED1690853.1 2,3-diketo-5-methylthiopentyl-1-phosphate enolase [Brevibacillus agri]MED1699821.1 2,3-diketo-5-methylthiopentyl-1-phosphate enolase [Brevibacillus agri]